MKKDRRRGDSGVPTTIDLDAHNEAGLIFACYRLLCKNSTKWLSGLPRPEFGKEIDSMSGCLSHIHRCFERGVLFYFGRVFRDKAGDCPASPPFFVSILACPAEDSMSVRCSGHQVPTRRKEEYNSQTVSSHRRVTIAETLIMKVGRCKTDSPQRTSPE